MRTFALCLIFGLVTIGLSAQVKIGDNPETISASSLLELESDSRVLVITRMSNVAMLGTTPLRGALVYNNDEECVFYFDGTNWQNLCADTNTTNVSLELDGSELVLTDSEGNTVSVTIESAVNQTFSTDPIVNFRESIVITEDGNNYNFEVGEITGDNVVNGSLNGVDIQDDSITNRQLSANSVGQEELAENSVTDIEIDYSQVTLNDFTNDAGFITDAQQISNDPANDLELRDGIFYDDAPLQTLITDNTVAIAEHIAADSDVDQQNELITNIELQGQDLIFTEGGNQTSVSLAGVSSTNTDNQTLAEVLTEGNNAQGSRIVNLGEPIDLDDAVTKDYVDNALANLPAGSDSQNLTGAVLNTTTNELTISIENGNPATVDLSPLAGGAEADGDETIIQQGTNITITGVGTSGDPYIINSTGGGGTADGNISNVQFTSPNLEFTGANGGFNGNVDLSPLLNTDNQNAAAVEFTPYLSLESIDSQAAIEELKDEVDAIVVAGGSNPNDELISSFEVNGGNLELVEAGTTFQVPLADIGTSGTDDQNLAEVLTEGADAGGTIINNIGLPAADNDAASKIYVDDAISNITAGTDNQNASEVPVVATPTNYTPAAANVEAHLAAIDGILGNTGEDNQNASEVPVVATPTNYTPAAANVEAHLAAIDAAIATSGNIVVSENIGNLLVEGTDGGAFLATVDDGDADDTNEIELPVGGNPNQVLSTDGAGNYSWVDQNTSATIVSGNLNNLITAGTDGGALLTDANLDATFVTETELSTYNFDDDDASPTNEIELPAGGNNGQILSTDGLGNYAWVDDETSTTQIVSDDADNLITAGSDQGAFLNINTLDAVFATNADLANLDVDDNDANPNNEIELPPGGNNGQILSTDGNGLYTWVDDQTTAGTIVSADNPNLIGVGTDGGALLLSIEGQDIGQMGATDGEVLTWNNSSGAWVPDAIPNPQASDVVFTPTANTTSDTVQDAIEELQTEIDGLSTNATAINSSTSITINGNGTTGNPYIPSITPNSIQGSFNGGGNPSMIITNTIGQADIADGAIGGAEIQSNAVSSDEIDDLSIQNIDIANTTITAGKLAPSANANDVLTTVGGVVVWAAPSGGGSIYTGGTGISIDGANSISIDQSELVNSLGSNLITDGTILDVDISTTAAIAGSKIDPDFGAQNIVTTGTITSGDITSGAINTTGNLTVNGDVTFTGTHQGIPDYVFQNYFDGFSNLKENYQFKELAEVEHFIKTYKHLPGITSAKQAKEQGFWNLSQSNLQNLEKIEELFLHTIAQEKKIDALEAENKDLADKVDTLSKEIEAIKAMLLENQK
ncbi:hypothetical protein GCM10011414_23140 [Croceivirga lutea]|uniref:hypothetical protein n=1 Tax=Croceivirga lutea TaxID=1775167 RepID=UPI001639A60A|nr:hypothetical protein [Croceivirga lutea]GGG52861.1 hypothetical protein GCM10011414_23140 [Croceivirga lutea]